MSGKDFIDQDFENEFASDDEINDVGHHGKLLQAVQMLDSQIRIKPPTRTEPSLNISEFDLAPVKGGGVHLKELAQSLESKGKAFDTDVATKIRKLTKANKTLVAPLEKPEAQKIKRIVAYKNLKKNIGQWDALIQTNRTARSITYPMNIEPVFVSSSSEVAAMWQSQAQTPLEVGLNALHGISKVYQEDKKEEEKFRLTFAELREKRQEMAKLRSQLSFEAAKARRQKKIKSKSYHRILRREKMQKQLKEFEALQKTDPEAALKQLQELEKTRAEERMTLRHKSTGNWARSRLIRAKYDTQTRQQLAEQLAVSRDLTKKSKAADSSDEDEQDGSAKEQNESVKRFAGDENNPWITVKSASEIDEFVSGYRKYWDEHNKLAQAATENREEGESTEDKRLSALADSLTHSRTSERTNQQSEERDIQDVGAEERTVLCEESETQEVSEAVYSDMQQSGSDNSPKSMHREVQSETENQKVIVDKKEKYEHKESESTVIATKLEAKCDKRLKCKKSVLKSTPKKKVISTCGSWIVTPIINQTPGNSVPCENEATATDTRIDTFLTTVLSNISVQERKKKKTKKSTFEKMFEEVENNISLKIQDKIYKLKSDLDLNSKESLQLKSPENEDKEHDLGASLALKSTREMRPTEDTELFEGPMENSRNGIDVSELVKKASGVKGAINGISGGNGNTVSGSKSAAQTGINTKPAEANINPEDFIVAKPKVLLTAAPVLVAAGEEALDDEMEDDQQKIITEAFADDNVVDDFRKEKEDAVKKSQPGEIDLTLPGWGSWGGAGIENKPTRRFFIKPPPPRPRRDANKSLVIIKEEEAESIRELQVSELPEPFRSVKDFEASIRAPVGSTWVPETAHKKLIEPAVVTKMGTVIKPISEEFLVNKKTLLEFAD